MKNTIVLVVQFHQTFFDFWTTVIIFHVQLRVFISLAGSGILLYKTNFADFSHSKQPSKSYLCHSNHNLSAPDIML